MKTIRFILACYVIIAFTFTLTGCNSTGDSQDDSSLLIPVIFDTDANNELDDQHALAYLLLNQLHWKQWRQIIRPHGFLGRWI